MIKTIFIFCLLLIQNLALNAQILTNYTLKGKIIDNFTNKFVEYATVSLKKDTLFQGAITDKNGKFSFEVLQGNYILKVSFIGYKNYVDTIEINKNIDLGTIKLQVDDKQLGEVVVEGQKEVIKDELDKIVYSVENDKNAEGKTVWEIMRKVPFVTINPNEQLEINGNANITIFIDGRFSAITSNLARFLQTLPTNTVKSIEVITNPSAKYDAEGTGGVINIITKKELIRGLEGSVYGKVGNRDSGTGINILYGTKKTLWVGSASISTDNYDSRNDITRFNKLSNTTLAQSSKTQNRSYDNNYSLGFDYRLNDKNTIVINTSASFGNTNTATQANSKASNSDNILQNISQKNISTNYDLQFIYEKQFVKAGQKLSILGRTNYADNANNYTNIRTIANDFTTYLLNNPTKRQETTSQIDYVQPISKKITIETGTKAIFRNFDINNTRTYAETPNEKPVVAQLNFLQNIYSLYVSARYKLNDKFLIQSGLRVENTDNSAQNYSQNYTNAVPTISVGYKFKDNSFKLGYSQRLSRPSANVINPFRIDADTNYVSIGNKNIQPEIAHNFDFTYSRFSDKWRITSRLSANFINGMIGRYNTVDANGKMTIQAANIGQQRQYSNNTSVTYLGIKKVSVMMISNLSYLFIDNGNYATQGSIGNIATVINYNPTEKLSFEAYISYVLPRTIYQGIVTNSYFSTFSGGYRFWNKRANISTQIVNPLLITYNSTVELTDQNFNSVATSQTYTPWASIGFSLRFGQEKNNRKDTKIINNNDQKDL
jgi:outer membrane receptor for ferrienterochelin and colicin